jgi:hypothetical protein
MLDPWFKHAYPLKHLKKLFYWVCIERHVLRDARGVLFTCEEERLLARQSFPRYRCQEVVVNFGTASPLGEFVAQRDCFLDRFPHLRSKQIFCF